LLSILLEGNLPDDGFRETASDTEDVPRGRRELKRGDEGTEEPKKKREKKEKKKKKKKKKNKEQRRRWHEKQSK
jgi:hypothetical protein